MSFLSSAAQAALTSTNRPDNDRLTMQSVLDVTTDPTERKRIQRLYDFFLKPLSTIDGDDDMLGWFDGNFPSLRILGARPLPGAERKFWKTRESYAKWREVVRRCIRAATGEIAAQKALRARNDGWTLLLAQLEAMTKDSGPVHVAQHGAIAAFADVARGYDLEPHDLKRNNIEALLDGLPLHLREKAIKALALLERLKVHRSVAAFLPDDFDASGLRAQAQTEVPENVRSMIGDMLDNMQKKAGTYDDVTKTSKKKFNDRSRLNYGAALVAVARAAADAAEIDLRSLNSLDRLFVCETRRAVIAHWTEQSRTDSGIIAASAAYYVRTTIRVCEANEIDMAQWRISLKNNPFLIEGCEKKNKMAEKNVVFCRELMSNPDKIKTFLSQHVLYQEAAKKILAKGSKMTMTDLRDVRRLGTCALYAAICVRGAAIRKGSALRIQVEGPEQNLFKITKGDKRYFELRISKKDMKGEYIELPPIPIRDDKYCGYEVVDWFLKEIRPLFDHANPEWCEENKRKRTPYLFPSEKSERPLTGSVLYDWIEKSSHMIGVPMSPHNFRHGFATLLLSKSWGNKERASAYLGCSPQIIEKHYGWIDRQQKLEETQDLLAGYLAG